MIDSEIGYDKRCVDDEDVPLVRPARQFGWAWQPATAAPTI